MDHPFGLFMAAVSPFLFASCVGFFAVSVVAESRAGHTFRKWHSLVSIAYSGLLFSGSAVIAWIAGFAWVLLLTPLAVYTGARLEPKRRAQISRKS